MNENNTQVVVMDDNAGFTVDFSADSKSSFCSLKGNTHEEKALLFRAMNNPDKRLGDCIGDTIAVVDIFAEVVTCTNDDGVSTECPRIVLIDDKGVSHQAVSKGVYGALQKMVRVFGAPSFDPPINIKVIQKTIGAKKMLTFDVVI